MKFLITIALCLGISATLTSALEDKCHNHVSSICSNPSTLSVTSESCNALFGGFKNVENELQAYANHELVKSYQYLLMATHFNSYQKNRHGFRKLYQSMSDRSFDNTIDLIKQISRRGGKVDFNNRRDVVATGGQQLELEVDELHSLAIALDAEKRLAIDAAQVHSKATHGHSTHAGGTHDPETAHYLEEKFLGKQADSIRKLSGYANDLSKMMNQQDPSLAVYLFDEYLAKQ